MGDDQRCRQSCRKGLRQSRAPSEHPSGLVQGRKNDRISVRRTARHIVPWRSSAKGAHLIREGSSTENLFWKVASPAVRGDKVRRRCRRDKDHRQTRTDISSKPQSSLLQLLPPPSTSVESLRPSACLL